MNLANYYLRLNEIIKITTNLIVRIRSLISGNN